MLNYSNVDDVDYSDPTEDILREGQFQLRLLNRLKQDNQKVPEYILSGISKKIDSYSLTHRQELIDMGLFKCEDPSSVEVLANDSSYSIYLKRCADMHDEPFYFVDIYNNDNLLYSFISNHSVFYSGNKSLANFVYEAEAYLIDNKFDKLEKLVEGFCDKDLSEDIRFENEYA